MVCSIPPTMMTDQSFDKVCLLPSAHPLPSEYLVPSPATLCSFHRNVASSPLYVVLATATSISPASRL